MLLMPEIMELIDLLTHEARNGFQCSQFDTSILTDIDVTREEQRALRSYTGESVIKTYALPKLIRDMSSTPLSGSPLVSQTLGQIVYTRLYEVLRVALLLRDQRDGRILTVDDIRNALGVCNGVKVVG